MKRPDSSTLFPARSGSEVKDPEPMGPRTVQVRGAVHDAVVQVVVPPGTSALRAGLSHVMQSAEAGEVDAWYVIEMVA